MTPDPTPDVAPEDVDAVIVPLDGSAFSWPALRVAAGMSRTLDAGIHLVSAVASPEDVEERDAELAIAALDLPSRPVSRSVVVAPDPADAIVRTGERAGRHMVCMATHGRGRSGGLVGSVATAVVARSRSPVVLVCPLVDQRPRGQGVVACVDGDPASAALVSVALGWADRLHEPPVVVTVAEDAPEPATGEPVRRRFGPDGDVDTALDSLVRPFRERGRDVATLALYDPLSPWGGLYRYLSDHPAQLVVTGTHLRTDVSRVAFGSVAASIVRHSPSPVLMTAREDGR